MSAPMFSQAGFRALPDPMVDLFQRAHAAAGRFREKSGQELISFASGAPDAALMPRALCRKLAEEAMEAPGSLNYTMPQGVPALRASLERFLRSQGVACEGDNLLITSGGMEALSLGAWMTLNPGDVVLTEGPGFAGALSMFELFGAKVVQLECGEEGLTPEALSNAIGIHRPKLLSLIPDFQNPTGAVMPLEHRQAVGRLLQEKGVYALEDAAYAYLRFDGLPLPPLQSFAPEWVFHATSVSKIFSPAMRVGALVAPKLFADKATDIKSAYNMQASALAQVMTARFLQDERALSDQLQTLRRTYRARRDLMVEALEDRFPASSGYRWTRPPGGMFLWLTGPDHIDFTQLFDAALDQGVAYVPGSAFYAQGSARRHHSARLNFASTPEERIAEGIRRLADALREVFG